MCTFGGRRDALSVGALSPRPHPVPTALVPCSPSRGHTNETYVASPSVDGACLPAYATIMSYADAAPTESIDYRVFSAESLPQAADDMCEPARLGLRSAITRGHSGAASGYSEDLDDAGRTGYGSYGGGREPTYQVDVKMCVERGMTLGVGVMLR